MKKSTLTAVAIVLFGAVSGAYALGTGSLDRVSGWFPAGTNLTVNATPGANDQLSGWSGDTNSATFGAGSITFLVDGGKSITAIFSDIMHTITASAGPGGSLTPTGAVAVAQGDNQGFSIVPDANYHVTDVTVDSISQGPIGSYTFTNVMAAHAIGATFGIDQHTVTFNEGTHGSRTGGGALIQTIDHGAAATAPTISPDAGYAFTGWDTMAFTNVMGNLTVTAEYATNNYTLIYVAGANGSISGTATQTVAYGQNGSAVTAVADTGYHFVNWSDASTANPRTDTSVAANLNATANFAINQYTFTVVSPYGTPTPSGTTTSDWNSVISPAMADATVINGTTQYVATGWIGTGSLPAGSGTNTSFNITNDTTMSWQWTTNYWIEFQTTGN